MPSEPKRNLIVVSNRLPLSIKRGEDGSYLTSMSSGGLVTSLSGLTKTTEFGPIERFGWPGMSPKEPEEQEEVRRSLASHNAIPVFLDEELAQKHYNGFSSTYIVTVLWER